MRRHQHRYMEALSGAVAATLAGTGVFDGTSRFPSALGWGVCLMVALLWTAFLTYFLRLDGGGGS
jgi:hypothetical protein